MTKHGAYKLLLKFLKLEGHLFKRYNSKVKTVFVGNTIMDLLPYVYEAEVIHKIAFPELDTDTFTIVAKLDKGQFISVRSIIEEDKILDLLNDVEELDYVDGTQKGFNPLTGQALAT